MDEGSEVLFRTTVNSKIAGSKMKKEGPKAFLFACGLSNHKHCNPNARMQRVKQEVLAVDIVNVAVVVV